MEVNAATGEHRELVPGAVSWCEVDARAGVVWFADGERLATFDFTDRRVHPVIRGDFTRIEPIVAYADDRLGGNDLIDLRVGAKLAMTARPSISVEMGCDGDAAYYCYESDLTTPQPDVAADQAAVKAMTLVDPGYVAALVARGANRPLWTLAVAGREPPRRPSVDQAACQEDPGSCGQADEVPGTALWLVTVANARGDFYHVARQLWDPVTGEYLRIADGRLLRERVPTTAPDQWNDHAGMRVSETGVIAERGTVFDARSVRFHGEQLDRACGWASGGWRSP